jgi:hypothetical protein
MSLHRKGVMTTKQHLDDQAIGLYVDALKLDRLDKLPAYIVEHVADCEACKQQVMQLYRVLKDLDYSRLGPHPYLGRARTPRQRVMLYRIAAVLAVAIGLAVTLYYVGSRQGEHPVRSQLRQDQRSDTSGTSVPPAPKVTQSEYAANFIPSIDMEDLVGMKTRSGGLTVLSPKIGEAISFPLTFRWEGMNGPFELRILTNTQSERLRLKVDSSQVRLKEKLVPGLYYWILRKEGETLYIGKFSVGRSSADQNKSRPLHGEGG